VIAVTSGKGGVGKSNLVVNVGIALARQGRQVLLIDADLGLGNLDILLGLHPSCTIHDVLAHRKSLSEVLVEGPEGIKILPASSGIPEMAELDSRQKLFLLHELDTFSPDLDVVLIDTGAGISRNVLFFNIAAQEILVVANHEPTSLTDAYALIKVLATQHGERHFRLVVNGIADPAEGRAVYRTLLNVTDRFLGQEISLDFLGAIPHDEALGRAVLRQQAVLQLYPKARVSRWITQLAQRLWESAPLVPSRGNVKFFWQRLAHTPM
jgi:flagellar biosynthesis protein FlhG